ncbi:MAG: anthranilate synthase component I, partial [Candidatus Saccharibacteria bacterium]|nr:anthranilate synthase component I [Moraxellaceae bacterium]
MMNLSEFERLVAAGYRHIPVFRQRLADTDTPVSVFARLRANGKEEGARYLFESVQSGERWGRYSIIGLGSGTVLQYRQGEMRVQHPNAMLETIACTDPFEFIRKFQNTFKTPPVSETPALPSFTGGLVGYFAYDSVRYIEPRLKNVPEFDPINLPDIWLMVSDTVIVF